MRNQQYKETGNDTFGGMKYHPIVKHESDAALLDGMDNEFKNEMMEDGDEDFRQHPGQGPGPQDVAPRAHTGTRIIDGHTIIEPNIKDVKFGQGSGSNSHWGNKVYLNEVWRLQRLYPNYRDYTNREKRSICLKIVRYVLLDQHGRFIMPYTSTCANGMVRKYWVLASVKDIKKKVSQCMRQRSTTSA